MMTTHIIDIFRSKIAAYTWRYPDIPASLINREYQNTGCCALHKKEKINNTVVNIVTRAIDHKIIHFDDLTQAGYSAVMRAYTKKLCSNHYSDQVTTIHT